MKLVFLLSSVLIFSLSGCGGSSNESTASEGLASATEDLVKEVSNQIVSALDQIARVDPGCIVEIVQKLSVTEVLSLGTNSSGDAGKLLSRFSGCISE